MQEGVTVVGYPIGGDTISVTSEVVDCINLCIFTMHLVYLCLSACRRV